MATSGVLDVPSGLSYRGPSPIAIGRTLGLIVAATGTVVLIGWVFHLPVLSGVVPGWVPMKANTAAGLVLGGLALLLGPSTGPAWARSVRLALGAVVLALGAATVAEYAFGWRLGIDELLVRDVVGPPATEWPGRPSLIAALNFMLVGGALLTLDAGNTWRVRPSEALSLAMGLLAFVALEGYVFGKESLYYVPAFTALSLHTAIAFVALSVGLFVIRPTVGLMGSITADGIGGATLRRLLPISLVVPLVLGWGRLQGERAGYFDALTGLALVVTAMAACLMLLAFVSIAPLAAVEARNRVAEQIASERIRRLNRVYAVLSHINHAIVRERSLSAVFDHTCRIAVDQGGFSAAWVALAPATPGAPLTIAARRRRSRTRRRVARRRRRSRIRLEPAGPRPRRRPVDHRQWRRDRRPSARRLSAARGTGRRTRLSRRRLLPAAVGRCDFRRARPELAGAGVVRRRRDASARGNGHGRRLRHGRQPRRGRAGPSHGGAARVTGAARARCPRRQRRALGVEPGLDRGLLLVAVEASARLRRRRDPGRLRGVAQPAPSRGRRARHRRPRRIPARPGAAPRDRIPLPAQGRHLSPHAGPRDGAARRPRQPGRAPRRARRRHPPHRAAGAVPPGAEDGEPGPPRRRHRPRLQQPADDHQRHRRSGPAAVGGCRGARRRLAQRPRRRRARARPSPASSSRSAASRCCRSRCSIPTRCSAASRACCAG